MDAISFAPKFGHVLGTFTVVNRTQTKRSADSRTHTPHTPNKENKIEHKSTKTIYERQLNVQCVCNIVVDLTSSNSFPNLTQIWMNLNGILCKYLWKEKKYRNIDFKCRFSDNSNCIEHSICCHRFCHLICIIHWMVEFFSSSQHIQFFLKRFNRSPSTIPLQLRTLLQMSKIDGKIKCIKIVCATKINARMDRNDMLLAEIKKFKNEKCFK